MGTYDRKRAGFLAFLRPRVTVSPISHQPLHDTRPEAVHKSALHTAPQIHESPNVESSDWSNLPEHLIESILTMLQDENDDALQRENRLARLVSNSTTRCLESTQ